MIRLLIFRNYRREVVDHFATRGSYYIEYHQLICEEGQMVPMYKVIADLLDRPICGLESKDTMRLNSCERYKHQKST